MGDSDYPSAERGTQRVGGFVALPALLHALGGDVPRLLAVAGLDREALGQPDGRILFRSLGLLLDAAASSTGCAHVGLLAGRSWHLSDLGLLGELCRHSATVGDALHALAFHQRINSDAGAAFLLERDGWVDLGYAIYCADATGGSQISEAALACGFNFLRELCGGAWLPTQVQFAHARPADARPHRAFFKVCPKFDADYAAIRFPARWMQRRIEGADPLRRAALEVEASGVDDGDLLHAVRRAVRIGLVTGRSSGDDVAQSLSLHRRTLNRRLEAEGTTFQALLDAVRFDTARQLLDGSRLPLDDVAAALGYGGVTQFMRRFRHWTGTTPGDWRRRTRSSAVRSTLREDRSAAAVLPA